MSVLDGVERDIESLPADLRGCGLAELARAMATRIDTGKGSPSECGKVLADTLGRLRDLAPPVKEEGPLDDLATRRAKRLAAAQA